MSVEAVLSYAAVPAQIAMQLMLQQRVEPPGRGGEKINSLTRACQ